MDNQQQCLQVQIATLLQTVANLTTQLSDMEKRLSNQMAAMEKRLGMNESINSRRREPTATISKPSISKLKNFISMCV